VPADAAIRGFRGVRLRLAEPGPTAELLGFMGYAEAEADASVVRMVRPGGNGADVVEIETPAGLGAAVQGAGSVHHVAFAVRDRAAQAAVRAALLSRGAQVTPVIDRDYFWAIYFRSPGGVLFEVATAEPGFDRDEDPAHLGEALKLPEQHAHMRAFLERHLEPIE
jgi:glyoxalase family protein